MARCGLRVPGATSTLILRGSSLLSLCRETRPRPSAPLPSWTQGGGPKDAQKTSGSGSHVDHWPEDHGPVIQPKDAADDAALSETRCKGTRQNELGTPCTQRSLGARALAAPRRSQHNGPLRVLRQTIWGFQVPCFHSPLNVSPPCRSASSCVYNANPATRLFPRLPRDYK